MIRALAVIVLLVFEQLAGAQGPVSRGQSTDIRISFIDVGQGDAIWIQTPPGGGFTNGANILIDGGPDRGANNRLITYLQQYGLAPGRTIDYMVVTHPHDDHYPGLLDVLAQYQVATVIDSGFPKTGTRFGAFMRAVRAERAGGKPPKIVLMREAREVDLRWGTAKAEILYADRADAAGMGSANTRENNASTVIRMSIGKFSFLFMGDAEGRDRRGPDSQLKYVEKALIDNPPDGGLRSTVLKAGHHGSNTGSTLAFLRSVMPDVVVVMSGRKRFGTTFLPDEAVLGRYQQVNPKAVVLRTDDQDEAEGRTTKTDSDGDDIYMRTDGKSLRVYQAMGPDGRRRWVKVTELQ